MKDGVWAGTYLGRSKRKYTGATTQILLHDTNPEGPNKTLPTLITTENLLDTATTNTGTSSQSTRTKFYRVERAICSTVRAAEFLIHRNNTYFVGVTMWWQQLLLHVVSVAARASSWTRGDRTTLLVTHFSDISLHTKHSPSSNTTLHNFKHSSSERY